jgi:hypothetical protein
VSTNGNDIDQEARAMLGKVVLDLLAADPTEVQPFESSQLSWKVSAPKEFFDDVGGVILLNEAPVDRMGDELVSPVSSATYAVDAKAGRYRQHLGDITVQVNQASCSTFTDTFVPFNVEQFIKTAVANSSDPHVYFQPVGPQDPPSLRVWITDGRLNISMRLGFHTRWVDPLITLSVSFGLEVVPGVPQRAVRLGEVTTVFGPTTLAPTNVVNKADVHVSDWVWLIPGAMIFLPVQLQNGRDAAERRAADMIAQIVDYLDSDFSLLKPRNSEIHDVRLYVDQAGEGVYEATYCPVPVHGTEQ